LPDAVDIYFARASRREPDVTGPLVWWLHGNSNFGEDLSPSALLFGRSFTMLVGARLSLATIHLIGTKVMGRPRPSLESVNGAQKQGCCCSSSSSCSLPVRMKLSVMEEARRTDTPFLSLFSPSGRLRHHHHRVNTHGSPYRLVSSSCQLKRSSLGVLGWCLPISSRGSSFFQRT
jgi:hypothetical protein